MVGKTIDCFNGELEKEVDAMCSNCIHFDKMMYVATGERCKYETNLKYKKQDEVITKVTCNYYVSKNK